MTRSFTGTHMLLLMIGFFGLIIAVNVTMARLAVGTFGGEVVENSYVASQRFNGWLAAARAQDRLGWHVVPAIDGGGRLRIVATGADGVMIKGSMAVTARHPLGRLPDQHVRMLPVAEGYVADRPLPKGRWLLRIDLQSAGHDAHFEDAVRT
ncbi:FixH family protein [Sphingomonas sp. MMS24-J45]|uniref:FixH family protein n=1 Tax=Sphingomonas sp. MMS24-J45 TaxID=3238806 RepID=UPI00384FD9AF